MADERRQRAEEIFQEAVELPAEQQAAFLDAQCGPDAALRAEAEALLGLSETAVGGFLRTPIHQPGGQGRSDQAADLPQRIGHYTIVRQIGEGGMGVVYEAQQESPHRTVALKVIRPGLTSKDALRRFRHEAEILGQLQHPGIAHIYEAGVASAEMNDGRCTEQPFFAMEFVHGQSLRDYITARQPTVRERLELAARVCDALQHAHERGIVHRDLKPENILVVQADLERPQRDSSQSVPGSAPSQVVSERTIGQPVILDFGVARATNADLQTVTLCTEPGRIVGTVPYMSPEQVSGALPQVDARADIYAVGTILYELLAKRLPFDVRNCSILEAVRIIRESEPSRLSSIDRTFHGDVETIVAKALEKERDRRYSTAAELAADIRRYLRDEPIQARPPSTLYQLRKFARRNKILVSGICSVFMALAIGTAFTTMGLLRARAALGEAQYQAYRAGIAAAAAAIRDHDAIAARQFLEAAPGRFRNWEWRHLMTYVDTSSRILTGHADEVFSVAFSADGLLLATGSKDSTALLWNVAAGQRVGEPLAHPAAVRCVAFSPDRQRLACACDDHLAYIWDVNTGQRLSTLVGHEDSVRGVAFSPDGARIATASFDKTVRLWDAATGQSLPIVARHDGHVNHVVFSPDGARLVTAGEESTLDGVSVWDAMTGKRLARRRDQPHNAYQVAFAPNGSYFASASGDRSVLLFDSTSCQPVRRLWGHVGQVFGVAFSPDSTQVVSAGQDRTLRVWDSASGTELATLSGHIAPIVSVAFNPAQAGIIASASRDGTVRLWNLPQSDPVRVLRGHELYVYAVAFSPDGSRIASGSWDRRVIVWDALSGEKLSALDGHAGVIDAMAFSPSGQHLASAAGGIPGGSLSGINPEIPRLAAASSDNTIRVWDLRDNSLLFCLKGHTSCVYGVAFSPDGHYLASAAWDSTVRLWDMGTGLEVAALTDHDGYVYCVAFSPDGRLLASAGSDGSIRLRIVTSTLNHTPTRRDVVLRGHQGIVYSLAFSHDGSRLATGSGDETVRVWDVSSAEAIRVFRGHTGVIYSVAFSPDGSRLASGSDDQTIRLWDTESGEVAAVLRGHTSYVYTVAFSPDGVRLASGSGDSTVRIWDTVPIRDRE